MEKIKSLFLFTSCERNTFSESIANYYNFNMFFKLNHFLSQFVNSQVGKFSIYIQISITSMKDLPKYYCHNKVYCKFTNKGHKYPKKRNFDSLIATSQCSINSRFET